MIIKDMADIKHKLAQGQFGMLRAGGVATWINQLVKDEQGISMIKALRVGDAISDLDLFSWLVKALNTQTKQTNNETHIMDNHTAVLISTLQRFGPIDDVITLFTLMEAFQTDPRLKAKVADSGRLGHMLLLLAESDRDGTLIRNMQDVEHHLTNQDFTFLKANHVSRWVDDIVKHTSSLAMLEQLRSHGAVSDLDIYRQLDHAQAISDLEVTQRGRTAEIFALLDKFSRDGSLVIDNSEAIWHMANDYSLPLIRALVKIGANIDHNALLANTFAGDHNHEFAVFDYLFRQYDDFSEQALAAACACILSATHSRDDGHLQQNDINAIKVLLGKADSILDTVFDSRIQWADWHGEDYSLFGAFFRHKPEWLVSMSPDYVPSAAAVAEVDWDFVVCEGEFDSSHQSALQTLMARGADLPIDEIIEALEDNDKDEYVNELKALIV